MHMHACMVNNRALRCFEMFNIRTCEHCTVIATHVGVSSTILVIPTGASPLVPLLAPVQSLLQLGQRTDRSVNMCTSSLFVTRYIKVYNMMYCYKL